MKLLLLSVLVALFGVSHGQLNFLVMGDWGGSESWPYTTPGEVLVAKAMGNLAGSMDSKFSLALGDNFYSHGVTSVQDKRFQETFENVFTSKNLQTPFHVIAGNHDHYGNVSAEVAYTSMSSRWHFPSLWYTFTEKVSDNTTIQFVMIDTVVMAGQSQLADGSSLPGDKLPGPWDAKMAGEELQWIEQTLAASTADFLVVSGHYPVWSICEHGPTSLLVKELIPLFQKYKVTAYFNGHDHCEEHIKDPTDPAGVDYHTIGAAHDTDQSTDHKDDIPANSLKFHWASGESAFALVTVTDSQFVVKHYSGHGQLLYTAAPQPRRS